MANLKKDIVLGNFEDKVVYYNEDLNKFYFTYFNKYKKGDGKIVFFSIIGYTLLALLDGVIVFENISAKLLILLVCYIASVKLAKKLFKMDNPEQEKKEFCKNEKVLKKLLVSWKNKTILAMLILAIDIILNIITIYYFFAKGSINLLFFFSATVILFKVGNNKILKRYKILNKLIKKLSIYCK